MCWGNIYINSLLAIQFWVLTKIYSRITITTIKSFMTPEVPLCPFCSVFSSPSPKSTSICLHPVPGKELLKLLNFLWRVVKVILLFIRSSFNREYNCWKAPNNGGWLSEELWIRRVITVNSSPQTPGRREGLEIKLSPVTSDLINHAYLIKPPKTQKNGVQSFLVDEQVGVLGK